MSVGEPTDSSIDSTINQLTLESIIDHCSDVKEIGQSQSNEAYNEKGNA